MRSAAESGFRSSRCEQVFYQEEKGVNQIMASLAEMNLTRLSNTTLAKDFVIAHHGEWNHRDWLEFCASLEQKGYTPIDLDRVGLLLEKEKAEYFKYPH